MLNVCDLVDSVNSFRNKKRFGILCCLKDNKKDILKSYLFKLNCISYCNVKKIKCDGIQ